MKTARTAAVRAAGALILGVIALMFGGCTPVSAPRIDPQASRDAGPDVDADSEGDDDDEEERCSTPGEQRCLRTARQRERCEDGRWMAAADCGEGEVCGTVSGEPEGSCLAVADVCRGSGGSMVCDGAGIMYRCSDSGVAESSSRCESARHCQLGLAAGHCASCLPGEYRCEGDMLEACDAEGQRFEGAQVCADGTCDAAAGLCRGAPCEREHARCRGDTLEVCSAGDSEYRERERCGPGLCNAAANRCDACLPGARGCESETAVTCAADGSERASDACTGDTPHCVGAGQCVQCTRDAECPSPDACSSAYCDLVRGTCQPEPRPVGTPCPEGVCSEDGRCVACLADTDCPAPAACQERRCDPESQTCRPRPLPEGSRCGTGVCDAEGQCAGCNSDDDCPDAPTCQAQRCDRASRTCEPANRAEGTDCTAAFGAGSCEAGRCVQCRTDADCPAADPCEQAFCRSSDDTCQLRPAPSGAACSGGDVCDGAGRCVACVGDVQCGAHGVCQNAECSCEPGYVQRASGCELDACAKFDDNRCGASDDTGNRCMTTPGGYTCSCGAAWQTGEGQCYQSGSGASAHTVPNGSSWNVLPEFEVTCENAFDTNMPCASRGQLIWLNVCGLPDTNPDDCSALGGKADTLAAVTLRRVSYSGPLQDFGDPGGEGGSERVLLPTVGDVILVQSLVALHILRITALSAESMTYEWANLWRDTCWRPGGASCTAACSCPDGT